MPWEIHQNPPYAQLLERRVAVFPVNTYSPVQMGSLLWELISELLRVGESLRVREYFVAAHRDPNVAQLLAPGKLFRASRMGRDFSPHEFLLVQFLRQQEDSFRCTDQDEHHFAATKSVRTYRAAREFLARRRAHVHHAVRNKHNGARTRVTARLPPL